MVAEDVGVVRVAASGRARKPVALSSRPGVVILFYLAVIAVAEVVIALVQPVAGILVHVALLAGLVTHAALVDDAGMRRLLLPLTLAPLTRILSISMPLTILPQIYWYPIIYLPLAAGTIVVMRQTGLSRQDVGFQATKPVWQVLIVPTGALLGLAEYLILRPAPLESQLTVGTVFISASIFIMTTGLVEEWIFRGVLQRVMKDRFGWAGLLYVSLMFAVLHVGFLSVPDLVFVFGVAVLFAWLANKTRSIMGITLAHGLTNAGLYVIFPLLFR